MEKDEKDFDRSHSGKPQNRSNNNNNNNNNNRNTNNNNYNNNRNNNNNHRNNNWKNSNQNQNNNNSGSNSSNKKDDYGPAPMQIGSQRRGPLTPEEQKRRRENNLCFYCGSSNHQRKDCPVAPAYNKQRQVQFREPNGNSDSQGSNSKN
jgi:hypothetical protein